MEIMKIIDRLQYLVEYNNNNNDNSKISQIIYKKWQDV